MSELPDRPKSFLGRVDASGVPLLLARFVLGLVFLYYAFNKIGSVEKTVTFLKLIKEYELLPTDPSWYLNYTALILPWLELVCGLALIAGVFVRGAGVIVFGMLMVFTVAIAARAVGLQEETGLAFCELVFDCGCGGGPVNICGKLLVNSCWILLSLIPIFSRSRPVCWHCLPRLGRRAAASETA